MTKTQSTKTRAGLPFPNPLLRVEGRHARLATVVAAAQARATLPIQLSDLPATAEHDYALIDPALQFAELPSVQTVVPPAAGLSYSGFSREQRAAFLDWTNDPTRLAPPSFQHLYLATLEVRLLEADPIPGHARAELQKLSAAPEWAGNSSLSRVTLLAFWLAQDGRGLASWLATVPITAELWNLALGCQALLGQPLRASQLLPLCAAWRLPLVNLPENALALRLDSLAAALGQEPLAYALSAGGEAIRMPKPWRCHHRDLHLSMPQPELRPWLQPLLVDMLSVTEENTAAQTSNGSDPAATDSLTGGSDSDLGRAHLILEFRHSRSDVFDYVLRQAQKQTGFQQLMDEDRHMVYRIPFRRNEMRRFWQIWDAVQGWTNTRVYCDGRELDKWQIYPYSQYLR